MDPTHPSSACRVRHSRPPSVVRFPASRQVAGMAPPRVLPRGAKPAPTATTRVPSPRIAVAGFSEARSTVRSNASAADVHHFRTASRWDSQFVPLSIVIGQPLVMISEDHRLHGSEGTTKVVVTQRQTEGRLQETLDLLGDVHTLPVTLDAISAIALPLNLSINCRSPEQLMNDARLSMDALRRLESIHSEMSNLTEASATWQRAFHKGARACSAEDIQSVRKVNEDAAKFFLSTMQMHEGLKLTDHLLQDRSSRVRTRLKELKTRKRRKLDELRKQQNDYLRSIPLEIKRVKQREQQEGNVLMDAKATLAKLERNLQNLVAETAEDFRELEVKKVTQRRRSCQLEDALEVIESDLRLNAETEMKKRTALGKEISEAKAEIAETEAQLTDLNKNVIEGPRKEVAEQQQRVAYMANEYQRNCEQFRKKCKKLEEQKESTAALMMECDERRAVLELEFQTELLEIVSVDMPAEAAKLESTVLEQLREAGAAGCRRYLPGQGIVVRLCEGDAAVWHDAVIESASSWNFEHTFRVDDGRAVTQMLHPFNHSPRQMPCSEWDEAFAQYCQMLRCDSPIALDPISGERRNIFEYLQPVVMSGTGSRAVVHDVCNTIQNAYVAGCRAEEGLYPLPCCIVLTGPAGCGKSLFVRQLALLTLDQTRLAPILIRVADLHQQLREHKSYFKTAWNWVDAYLQCVYAAQPAIYKMLRQAMLCRRALLLLDGMYQAGDAVRQSLQRHVISVLKPQGHSILVTERYQDDATWPTSFLHASMSMLSEAEQQKMTEALPSQKPICWLRYNAPWLPCQLPFTQP